ncbi:MAG: LPS export ABC transporter ATP-binding protein [Candidatus Omnitrophota bacterium]|nr:MAG: LPS export ABC transporter ATP-binding protein [Candidatus Omnitrophota bacterium]HDN97931.1 LPS export ABC transporter ATP-binding protein [bacterium]
MMLKGINLRKAFKRKVVVQDISINVERGEIVGLLGPNGAGKTTTFEMMMGFILPDNGKIFIEEKDITYLPSWKRARLGISYLPQEISVFQKLTVEENLLIILESFIKDKREMENICNGLLEKMGLLELKKNYAYTLSGGEKRKLEIARSLINKPKFLLLDEPFSGIDPKTVSEIQKIMMELKMENIGILLTDHNVRDALKITDRAYLINEGKILMEGSPKEILDNPDSKKVYFGEDFEL